MSDRNPKPADMSWVNPYLIVSDLKGAIEFYEKAFDFKCRMTIPDDKGNPMHAELSHKDQIIMMGQANAEQGSKSAKDMGGSPVSLYLYVDNVDEACTKAKAAGAQVKMEPTDQFWGDRMCSLTCPENLSWTFATNVADFDPTKTPGGDQ